MNSAPNDRQARDGKTHEIPPSFNRFPNRLTGLRMPRKAQLALIADARLPSVMATTRFAGNSVAIATKGITRSVKVLGRYSAQKRSSVSPCKSLGQKMLRASAATSCQFIPAASAAPTKLPTLVPVTMIGLIPWSDRAFATPICASPRTEPPLSANPTRQERS